MLKRREMKKVFDLGFVNPIEISLQSGPDGKLYGLTREAIFMIDPENDQVSFLANPPMPIDSGMADTGTENLLRLRCQSLGI